MQVGGSLRQGRSGGTPSGARRRRPGAAIAGAVAALTAAGCVAPVPSAERALAAERVRAEVEQGASLYAAGDFVLAARRFRSAAAGAQGYRDLAMERKATTAECTAWLRARSLAELSECTLRLEALHGREVRSDPGLNTLLAMGAVAGHRPVPPFKVPTAVHPIVRRAAGE